MPRGAVSWREIMAWAGTAANDGIYAEELIAAVCFGYADESPRPRPRKSLDSVVEWR